MCGIAGIYNLNSLAGRESELIIEKMNHMMAHRGPDAEGLFRHGQVCFGHRRLAIIDLDHRSDQPFTDHTGRYTLVFNGQIYNFKEIRAMLPEYPFSTTSDTEVIVAAYGKWREKCLDRFNGMFALVIYDHLEQSLFIARDRFGVKPLYYFLDQDYFIFSSEIRPILSSGLVKNEVSKNALAEYLMFQSTICPNTIIEGVQQIKPAHYAYLSKGVLIQTRYWSYGSSFTSNITEYGEAIRIVRRLMFEAVERRMVSDVPLGAFLSGGIDSSAIVAIMSQITPRVNTFSITFNEKEYDESPFSNLIASKYNTSHHPILLRPEDLLNELPNALNAMDSPTVDGMNLYVISKFTKAAGVTVAMSGLGADELFAGYHYFRMWRQMKRLGFFLLPRAVRLSIAKAKYGQTDASRLERMKQLALSDGSIAETYPAFRQVSGVKMSSALIRHNGFSSENPLATQLKEYSMNQFPYLSQLSIAELTSYTHNVLLKDTDQFSMASSLEVREPFFDHRLVDCVVRLPDRWKLGNTPKKLLTDAMGDLLPNEIINRPKRGFILPWENWLRTDLRSFVTEQIEFLSGRPEFDGDMVRKIWTNFISNEKSGSWPYVWQLVAIAHWMRTNIT